LVGDNYCQEYAIVNNKKRQVYIPFYLLLCASAALRDKKTRGVPGRLIIEVMLTFNQPEVFQPLPKRRENWLIG
jgi:hypothetical protein